MIYVNKLLILKSSNQYIILTVGLSGLMNTARNTFFYDNNNRQCLIIIV